MSATLKNCPFCGSHAEVTEREIDISCLYSGEALGAEKRFDIGCSNEDCIAWDQESYIEPEQLEGVIAAWNRRTPTMRRYEYGKGEEPETERYYHAFHERTQEYFGPSLIYRLCGKLKIQRPDDISGLLWDSQFTLVGPIPVPELEGYPLAERGEAA